MNVGFEPKADWFGVLFFISVTQGWVEIIQGKNQIEMMEYVIPPAILIVFVRFAFPALITWFFEKFVEPKAKLARQQDSLSDTKPIEPTNTQKIAETRKSLNELRSRIGQSKG